MSSSTYLTLKTKPYDSTIAITSDTTSHGNEIADSTLTTLILRPDISTNMRSSGKYKKTTKY